QDTHSATQVRTARNEVRVTRERTKKVRARVHSETQIVAVRTQQQRDVKNELVANKSRLSGKRTRQLTALKLKKKQEQELISEVAAPAGADSSIRGRLAAAQGATDSTPSAAGLVWPVSGPVV